MLPTAQVCQRLIEETMLSEEGCTNTIDSHCNIRGCKLNE
jgi:hypothetical protein